MDDYGLTIHKSLVTEIAVSHEVMRSMNEINKQRRLRDASVMAAEAEKIRVVKRAEADAGALALAGEGIARQRKVIVEGLREAVAASGREITQDDVLELMLTTQYFETLRDIGAKSNCKAYFLPDDGQDFDSQVRQGMLEGQAALEFFARGGFDVGPSRPPQQKTMASSRPPRRPGGRNDDCAINLDEETGMGGTGGSAPAAPSPGPPKSNPMPPRPAPPPAPRAQQPVTLQVTVPPGVAPGQQLQVQAPDGRMVLIAVPPGVGPGTVLQVQA